MGPLPLEEIFGTVGVYAIYLLIGFAFGAVLEMAGFANTKILAAQFYFKDQTVLKVMFGAIVTAMVLIFLSSGLGFLDYSQIWVSPTYLWPGIVGGLIMGFGFIIGGFCPGTSLVALATLKIDGIIFTLGALFGIFLFGETVSMFEGFWNSSYLGRFTIPEWLDLSTGAVVLIIVLMAVFMFWGAEQLERIFGGKNPAQAPKLRFAGAGMLVVLAVVSIDVGQPTVKDVWQRIAAEKEPLLVNRSVQIHPGELVDLINDDQINLVMLDLRDEVDYNLFHLKDVVSVRSDELEIRSLSLLSAPQNTVTALIDNNEQRSTEGWKVLVAEGVPNVYILEGGMNYWLDIFGHDGHDGCPTATQPDSQEFRHIFNMAIGAGHLASEPDSESIKMEYTSKVKLEKKKAPKAGGCSS